jgi:hypothetical protein
MVCVQEAVFPLGSVAVWVTACVPMDKVVRPLSGELVMEEVPPQLSVAVAGIIVTVAVQACGVALTSISAGQTMTGAVISGLH